MTYEEELALVGTADANGGEHPKAYRSAWESACERASKAEKERDDLQARIEAYEKYARQMREAFFQLGITETA